MDSDFGLLNNFSEQHRNAQIDPNGQFTGPAGPSQAGGLAPGLTKVGYWQFWDTYDNAQKLEAFEEMWLWLDQYDARQKTCEWWGENAYFMQDELATKTAYKLAQGHQNIAQNAPRNDLLNIEALAKQLGSLKNCKNDYL